MTRKKTNRFNNPPSQVSDEPPETPSVHSVSAMTRTHAVTCIDKLLANPHGIQNGKNRRKILDESEKGLLKNKLLDALEYAAIYAANGPLPNKSQRRGRPPDNAVFIFIDDIADACKTVGLYAGRRYVEGEESFPVQVFMALSPLLWGPAENPRRYFERWSRLRSSLTRSR